MKKLLLAFVLCLVSSGAWAQCNGVFPNNSVCGNYSGASAPPTGTAASGVQIPIWANDKGAKCDGTSDDTAAFQTAINAAQTAGVPLRFKGTCIISSTLNITNIIDFGGTDDQGPAILKTNASGIGAQILVNGTNPVNIHDYECLFTAPTGSDFCLQGTATLGQTNFNSRFWRLNYTAGIPIVFDRFGSFIFRDSMFFGAGGAEVALLNQTSNTDAGDMNFDNVLFACSPSTTTGLLWIAGGGLKVVNSKFEGTNCITDVALQFGGNINTGDMFFANNEFEGQSVFPGGDCIRMTRTTTNTTLGAIVINGNEMACQFGIRVPIDTNGAWVRQLIITSNIWISTPVSGSAFTSLASVNGMVQANNIATPPASGATQISKTDSSVTSCFIGFNVATGPTSASTVSSCTTGAPF